MNHIKTIKLIRSLGLLLADSEDADTQATLREADKHIAELGADPTDSGADQENALRDGLMADLTDAEAKAWDALSRYKFWMFGYYAADVVKLRRRLNVKIGGNPFGALVNFAMKRQTLAAKGADWGNPHRAETANVALTMFGDLVGQPADDESTITDLLVNLRHWCDRQGLDFAEHDRIAHSHYVAELAETDTAPCNECGAEIPDHAGGGLANKHHAESCSLYDADKE